VGDRLNYNRSSQQPYNKGSSLTEFVIIFPFMVMIIMFFINGILIVSEKYLLKYVVYAESRRFLVDEDITQIDLRRNILEKLGYLPYNKSIKRLEFFEDERLKGLNITIDYQWPFIEFNWAHFSFEEYCVLEK